MIHMIHVIHVIQFTDQGRQFGPAVPELVVQVVLVEVELQLHEPTWIVGKSPIRIWDFPLPSFITRGLAKQKSFWHWDRRPSYVPTFA